MREDGRLSRRRSSRVICSSNDGGARAAVSRLVEHVEASLASRSRASPPDALNFLVTGVMPRYGASAGSWAVRGAEVLGSVRLDPFSSAARANLPPATLSKVATQATAHGQLLGLTESAAPYSRSWLWHAKSKLCWPSTFSFSWGLFCSRCTAGSRTDPRSSSR